MTTDPTALSAVSPLDGRYRKAVEPLADFFSERALIKYRIMVEIEYFIALCRLPLPQLSGISEDRFPALRNLYRQFDEQKARQVKDIEAVTNHDVKAVEYYLKEQFDNLSLTDHKEFIHFGLTSQDVNNTAVPCALKEAWQTVLRPALQQTASVLGEMALAWKEVPMLARTHGQPASPTRVGKELYVFVDRLEQQMGLMAQIPFSAKFGGASGNFNAHVIAFPRIDWIGFAERLLNDAFGLQRQRVTTQIEHYDHLAAFCDNLKRINTILIDLDRDIWAYISIDYFKQKIKAGEVGSSTMPHKVNPIDFENSEGNLGVANAVLEHLAAKLPVSRWQRDLTDSTVLRNLGVPCAHSLIGVKSLVRGLNKIILNEAALRRDLRSNWAVVTEGIQTLLRREGYPEPYETLKALTRTPEGVDQAAIVEFVNTLDLDEAVKKEILAITPENYIGLPGF